MQKLGLNSMKHIKYYILKPPNPLPSTSLDEKWKKKFTEFIINFSSPQFQTPNTGQHKLC